MNQDEQDDQTVYRVVLNHEEQYSIWPAERENPPGWHDAGKSGLKDDCLAYIDMVWTDMRPLSVRQRMAEHAAHIAQMVAPLTQSLRPVRIAWRPEVSALEIKAGLEEGFIPLAFVEAPELPGIGVNIDHQVTELRQVDWVAGSGTLHLVGTGQIYALGKVHVTADLDLTTKSGEGQLTILEPTSQFVTQGGR